MGSGEKTTFLCKKLRVYGDRNLKEKFWYEVCESVLRNWSEFSALS
jgi:hypothetical protein